MRRLSQVLTPIALSLACMAPMASQAQDKFVLRVSHFLPATSNAQVNVIQPWCDTLARESQQRLTCQIYPSMQLGGTPAQLADQVRRGRCGVDGAGLFNRTLSAQRSRGTAFHAAGTRRAGLENHLGIL
ncbi:TRAP-type C4-dicarboxylate transport system substrate-binding protein [Kerstersia gyiorum]|uniref:hypothetical protein n=1 Tax=Kerstersia gyiorum TaxID=206506 RepID=UPI00209DA885|nr:TRAP-type C4-dicarboxylate transport system substrate-binding protein [Kerstersia gyiorum]